MTKLPSGFYDDPLNEKLKTRTKALLSTGEIDFFQIFTEAQKLTFGDAKRKPSQYKQRNFMAENMYGNSIGLLFDNYQSYLRRDKYKRPFIRLEPDIRVYVKKLTPEKYLPSNIETEHVKHLKYQELFTADSDRIHVLFAGFVLNEEDWFIPFKEICISYLNKFFVDRAAWTIDLKDYRKQRTITTPMVVAENNDSLVTIPDSITPKTASK